MELTPKQQKEFNSVTIIIISSLLNDASVILTADKINRYNLMLKALKEINGDV